MRKKAVSEAARKTQQKRQEHLKQEEQDKAIRKIQQLVEQDQNTSYRKIAYQVGWSEKWVAERIKEHPEWGHKPWPKFGGKERTVTEENAEKLAALIAEHDDWDLERLGREIKISSASVRQIVCKWELPYRRKCRGRSMDDPAKPYYKPRKKPPEPKVSLQEAAKQARAAGMSYGRWEHDRNEKARAAAADGTSENARH